MSIETIKQNYLVEQGKCQKITEQITIREAQIKRLQVKKWKQQDKSWWGDLLIRPIMQAVREKYPHITWYDDELVPMGLRCAVTVFGYKGEKTRFNYENLVASITFTTGDLREGGIFIDTGEIKNFAQSGSIAELNGFNNVTKEVTSFEDVFEHIEFSIEARSYINTPK